MDIRDDDIIESLGRYFVHLGIAARYGITFEQFVHKVEIGTWKEYVA